MIQNRLTQTGAASYLIDTMAVSQNLLRLLRRGRDFVTTTLGPSGPRLLFSH